MVRNVTAIFLLGCAACGSSYGNTSGGHGNGGGAGGGSGGVGSGAGSGTTSGSSSGTTSGSTATSDCREIGDAGRLWSGTLTLSANQAPAASFTAGFGALVPDGCLVLAQAGGGCCVGSEAIVTAESEIGAGSIALADNATPLGELAINGAGLYAYTGTALAPQPGDQLSVTSVGAQFPAFSAQVAWPASLSTVRGPAINPDGGATGLSLTTDLVLSWTPLANGSAFNVTILQNSGAESGICPQPSQAGFLSLSAPLYVTCSAPGSSGALTIPSALLADADFALGAAGTIAYASQSAAAVVLPLAGESPSEAELQVTASVPGSSVDVLFIP